nr:Uncharacterised protein [Raoultella sp. NCTC 9187]
MSSLADANKMHLICNLLGLTSTRGREKYPKGAVPATGSAALNERRAEAAAAPGLFIAETFGIVESCWGARQKKPASDCSDRFYS